MAELLLEVLGSEVQIDPESNIKDEDSEEAATAAIEDCLLLAKAMPQPETHAILQSRLIQISENAAVNVLEWDPFFDVIERQDEGDDDADDVSAPRHIAIWAEMLNQMLAHTSIQVRAMAIRLWASIMPWSLPQSVLPGLLHDPDPRIRRLAIDALGPAHTRQPAVLNALLDAVINSEATSDAAAARLSTESILLPRQWRDRLVNRLLTVLEQQPSNRACFRILWTLLAPPAVNAMSGGDSVNDVPF